MFRRPDIDRYDPLTPRGLALAADGVSAPAGESNLRPWLDPAVCSAGPFEAIGVRPRVVAPIGSEQVRVLEGRCHG